MGEVDNQSANETQTHETWPGNTFETREMKEEAMRVTLEWDDIDDMYA